MRPAARIAPLLALLALAGCGGDALSQAEYQTELRRQRDRVDQALAFVTGSTTFEQVVQRLRDAAATTRSVAGDVDTLDAPVGLGDENDRLASSLHGLADEVEATAAALEDPSFEEAGQAISGLEFENWNRVQDALQALRSEGIDVPALARH